MSIKLTGQMTYEEYLTLLNPIKYEIMQISQITNTDSVSAAAERPV